MTPQVPPGYQGPGPNRQPGGGGNFPGILRDLFTTGMKYTPAGIMANSFYGNNGNGSWQAAQGPSITDRMNRAPMGSIGSGLNQNKPTSIEDILAELQRLQNPDRYAVDPSLLERQAMAGASAQYDPIIAALHGQASVAQQRAQRNSSQLGSMYSGLSQSLTNDVAPIQQRFADTQAKTAQQYQDLQGQIKDQYASSQGEQEAMMKRLNIEAAAPQALAGQMNDKNFLVSNAATEGQNVQSQLAQQGAGAVNYTQQGSQMARSEGTNRQADLIATLGDYLKQIEGQVGSNMSAKAASAQGNYMSLLQSSQKNATDRAQADFNNYLKTIGVMQSMQAANKANPVKSPIDVGPRIMSLGLDAGSAQQVSNAFMNAISNDQLIQAGTDPMSGMTLTKEALAKRIVEAGQQQGLNPQQLNALQEAALEYFGRQ